MSLLGTCLVAYACLELVMLWRRYVDHRRRSAPGVPAGWQDALDVLIARERANRWHRSHRERWR